MIMFSNDTLNIKIILYEQNLRLRLSQIDRTDAKQKLPMIYWSPFSLQYNLYNARELFRT